MSLWNLIWVVNFASLVSGEDNFYTAKNEGINPYNEVNELAEKMQSVIEGDGFPCEVHEATTTDGYILTMFRIPFGQDQETAQDQRDYRPVVLLMHGMFASSSAFVALGPNKSMAYNLADAGFDVWMGNCRGNTFSRGHISLNPMDKQQRKSFFDFSWHQIGTKDLPTMIDFILETTKQRKLHYVGHSQGGTVFLVLNSMIPKYNDKIASASLLAGVGYTKNFPDNVFKKRAKDVDFTYNLALKLGLVELRPAMAVGGRTGSNTCGTSQKFKDICRDMGVDRFMELVDSSKRRLDLTSIISFFLPTGGASLKQVAHFLQNIRDGRFQQWNYGSPEKNKNVYREPNPTVYNLELITVNTTMHYSKNDAVLSEQDVLEMVQAMPRANARLVPKPGFSHYDYIRYADAKHLVTEQIINKIDYLDVRYIEETDQRRSQDNMIMNDKRSGLPTSINDTSNKKYSATNLRKHNNGVRMTVDLMFIIGTFVLFIV